VTLLGAQAATAAAAAAETPVVAVGIPVAAAVILRNMMALPREAVTAGVA
jgi:hypothetical protein